MPKNSRKRSYYSIIFLSESTDLSHNLRIQRGNFWTMVFFLSLVFCGFIFWTIYSVPKVKVSSEILNDYQRKTEELKQVADLIAEFEGIRMLDKHIREVLLGSLEEHASMEDISNEEGIEYFENGSMNQKYDEELLNVPNSLPVVGYLTQGFQTNSDPFSQAHLGIDIIAPEGEMIYASAGGLVIFSGATIRYGNLIIIDHSDGFYSFYGHNRRNLVATNIWVKRSQPIATLGNTGQSTGPHLHFEIWKDGIPVNPTSLIPALKKRDISGD